MWTPVSLKDGTISKYGFGWFLRPVPGHKTVAHGGALPGFSTFIWRFIDDKLTVIVLSNCETADTGRIALGVAGLYIPPCCLLKSKSSFRQSLNPSAPSITPVPGSQLFVLRPERILSAGPIARDTQKCASKRATRRRGFRFNSVCVRPIELVAASSCSMA